jgi:Tfp pilus assembly protein PilV
VTALKERGLTVIETLIAATLFLTAIIVLIGIFPASARAARQAQGHLLGTNIAERELEICRAQDYDALEDRTEQYKIEVENNGVAHEITFEVEVKVSDVRPGLKRIRVEVDWLGPDYFNRGLKMETYAANLAP